ncbi:hypothetical protein CAAN3_07S04852 [[Candida] anglica]
MNIQEDDKRKGRFGWVKRLMQGQQRASNGAHVPVNGHIERNSSSRPVDGGEGDSTDNEGRENISFNSDNITTNSYNTDNVSTTPLKSLGSTPSTKSPSVLSDNHQDNVSYVASTADTSIAPSTLTHHLSYPVGSQLSTSSATTTTTATNPNTNSSPNNSNLPTGGVDNRDSESIVTLASSSRRLRRRSLDTNCSTAGIPPASIMERLSVNPTAANSTYAMSMYDRGSVYNNDAGNSIADSQEAREDDREIEGKQ